MNFAWRTLDLNSANPQFWSVMKNRILTATREYRSRSGSALSCSVGLAVLVLVSFGCDSKNTNLGSTNSSLGVPQTNGNEAERVVLSPTSSSTNKSPSLPSIGGSTSASDRFSRGAQLLNEGKFAESLELYEQGLKIVNDDEEAHFNAGFLAMKLGRTNEAIHHYRESLKILPDYAEAHNNLGNVLRRQGNLDEAIVEFTAAIKSAPSNSSSYNNLGTALAQKGKLAEAIPNFEKAIQLNPQFEEALFNLGNAYVQQNRLEEGALQYRRTLEINPKFERARRELTKLQTRLGKTL